MASDSLRSPWEGSSRNGTGGVQKCGNCRTLNRIVFIRFRLYLRQCSFDNAFDACSLCRERELKCGPKLMVRATKDDLETRVVSSTPQPLVPGPQRRMKSQTDVPEPAPRLHWEGRDIPFRAIKSRFDIDWNRPIGGGGYGKVYAVCKPP